MSGRCLLLVPSPFGPCVYRAVRWYDIAPLGCSFASAIILLVSLHFPGFITVCDSRCLCVQARCACFAFFVVLVFFIIGKDHANNRPGLCVFVLCCICVLCKDDVRERHTHAASAL